MRCKVETTTKYTLELDEQEALWIRNSVQNPLVKEESTIDSDTRHKIFQALTTPDSTWK